MVMMITAPQRRLLVLLSTFFFIFSIFYCCSRLAALTVGPKTVEEPDPVPQVELLRADNPMSYGMYNRPTYDGIDLIRNLPSKYIPTTKNKRRLVVVGDIHGMLDPFEKLLKKIEFDPETDHLIAVGDMINKGPKSSEVIDRLMEIKASAVRGNHEDRVILAWRGLSSQQGVAAYLDTEDAAKQRGEAEDLKTARSLTEPQMTWLKKLPVIISAEPMALYFVHAGLVPGVPLPQQDAWAVMNMRTLRFPREEFRKKEIEKKRKQAEKQRQKELEKAQEAAQQVQAGSNQRRSIPEEAANLHAHIARGEPAEAKSANAASLTDEDVDLERTNPDRDIWLPIDGHEGERWTKLWNKEQKKLPGPDRRSVIYGHDAKMGYQEDSYTFGLDSGCVKGNALTALVVQANENGGWKHSTYQVTCKKGWW
ncbi:ser thr phosphatase family [Fusarium longipes]|uniref:Ser thr phosphatase family n=1 Tax=Fusarium longipes TaxID=694270 RepID=A0A395SY66_9HYPO|nr:ser thr phosphatase family [Fusarium longipes]